jgi:hypothetical protein
MQTGKHDSRVQSIMSNPPLPTPRTLITLLLNSISDQTISTSSTPGTTLKDAPSSIKPLLLTLHVLFPQEFLPALDVLDRRLVTRFHFKDDANDEYADRLQGEKNDDSTKLYFVRSAQQNSATHSSRFINPLNTHYEVRPMAWNCSCPAFAFSAFPALLGAPPPLPQPAIVLNDTEEWSFGGLSLAESGVPVCKHLLACVLVERCPGLFGASVEEKVVERGELAGWCAGWGA